MSLAGVQGYLASWQFDAKSSSELGDMPRNELISSPDSEDRLEQQC